MQPLTHTCHYLCCTYNELSEQERQLVEAAKLATRHSYAPYSRFQVGAAALLGDGTIVTGANQENAAYPSGLCAERTALFHSGAAHPGQPVIALAIAAYTNGKFTNIPVPPCGACRQVMLETEQRYGTPIRILLFGTESIYIIPEGVTQLLPLLFDASMLK